MIGRQVSSTRSHVLPMDQLAQHFDLIITGTGLTETILAAAASRSGKSVLQLDRNAYYGAEWASMSFSQFENWVQHHNKSGDQNTFYNYFDNVELVTKFDAVPDWSHDKLNSMTNRISIDLCPRLIFSDGLMVNLLVQSNICRYLEFKNCTQVCQPRTDATGDSWTQVPCTRSAVFNDKQLSLIQKRKFMKFIEKCLPIVQSGERMAELRDLSFDSFLEECDLDDRLLQIMRYVVATDFRSTSRCLKFLESFVKSAGRFGPTPYLWTLYGSGELPQAFARLSAVFGGTYCLNQEIKSVTCEDGKVKIHLPDRQVTSAFLVGSVTSLPLDLFTLCGGERYSRAVCILNHPILCTDENQIASANLSHDGHDVTLIEVGSGSLCICPGLFLLHMSCISQKETSQQDLMHVCQHLFAMNSERNSETVALWSCFFNCQSPTKVASKSERVFAFLAAKPEVDYETNILEAKAVFQSLFPEEEFLPRAPDVEDIVIEEEHTKSEPE